jgi:hypothetical protein
LAVNYIESCYRENGGVFRIVEENNSNIEAMQLRIISCFGNIVYKMAEFFTHDLKFDSTIISIIKIFSRHETIANLKCRSKML